MPVPGAVHSSEPKGIPEGAARDEAAKSGRSQNHSNERRRSVQQREKREGSGGAATGDVSSTPTKKLKEEVFLVVSVVTTGRTPLNGWILSFGAVAIAAATRRVLGIFTRNCQPLLPATYVEPAPDVAGFLRRQRAELELFTRGDSPVLVETAMQDLKTFCAPYAYLTLVASPLFSVYGWLSYYWSRTFSAATTMPWGFSGLCARSYAAGLLRVPMKTLTKDEDYKASFEGYVAVGVPAADALAAAVSFTHLYWMAQQQQQQQHKDAAPLLSSTSQAAPVESALRRKHIPPTVLFECEVPRLFAQLGCVPESAAEAGAAAGVPIRWDDALPGCAAERVVADGSINGAAPAGASPAFPTRSSLMECLLGRRFLHADFVSPPTTAGAGEDGDPSSAGHVPPFRSYPSITDCIHHPDFLGAIAHPVVSPATEWVATEKVHGSNFTVFSDGVRLWAAKRTGYLTLADSSSFFDFAYLIAQSRDGLLKARSLALQWLRKIVNSFSSAPSTRLDEEGVVVAVMCELAGGVYPHPSVPVDLRGIRVQNGVYYAPRNFLYGFDIAVDLTSLAGQPGVMDAIEAWGCPSLETCGKTASGSADREAVSLLGRDGRCYLPFDDCTDIFAAAGFAAYAQALHRGTLEEMLALPVVFPSTVAQRQLGLPAMETGVNEAEGYVLRPVRDVWARIDLLSPRVGKSTQEETWARVVLKRKHPRFDEFAVTNTAVTLREHEEHNHRGESTSPTHPTANGADTPVDLTPFLTTGRVESVLSKYTTTEWQDQSRMVAAVLADALKDAKTSHTT